MRYALQFCYNGAAYAGWQVQNNAVSVQEKLQHCLSTLLSQKINVVGAGRTDTGVHATHMVAHFDVENELNTDELTFRLNRFLPDDIFVYSLQKTESDFHARFSAERRTYHYLIHQGNNPFLNQRAWCVHFEPDLDKMNQAAKRLLGTHDFSSFSKSNTQTHTNLCTVDVATWHREGALLHFEVSANRFLRNMVRAMVGTLLEVGRGKQPEGWAAELLEKQDRKLAGESVPAHGLYLVQVKYPQKFNLVNISPYRV